MKFEKIIKTIILVELAIVIPIVIILYTWAMVWFPPNNGTKCVTTGKFYSSYEATDVNGNIDTYYEFRSNDGSVWWDLAEYQIDFVPKENTEYVFTYDNNGTTKENKPCDCAPEIKCECEVYDDIFVSVKEMN